MLTHALADVGRTCWWLDADDGGGTGGAATYYVLMQRTCLPSCTESIVNCLWIYGDLTCAPIMNTKGQTMCGTSRDHMVRMCENQQANSHAAWQSAPSKSTNTLAIVQ